MKGAIGIMLVKRRHHAAEASGPPRQPQRQHDTLQLRLYTSWDELTNLTAAWDDLLQHSVGPTIFSTPEWLGAWWRAFGLGKQLLTLAMADLHGTLVGLAPLYLEPLSGRGLKRLRLVGDGSEDSDDLDLLFRSGYEARGTAALLDWLTTQPGWDLCELNTLPADSPNVAHLLADLRRRHRPHSVYDRSNSAIILPESWETYLAQLSKHDAHNIKYYSRRLHRRWAVRTFRCTNEEELATYLEVLFELHQKRWTAQGEPGVFALLERRQFYADMGRAFLRRGWLEFWLLELEGQIAAARFDFRYGDRAFALQGGRDPASDADRVGFVLRAHVIEQLIASGVRRYDFLAGDDAYKRLWGAQPGSYTDVHFVARSYSWARLYMSMRAGGHAATNVISQWLRAHAPPAYALLSDAYRRYRRLRGMQ